jgi:cytochrome c553/mono/diheme cytochrome c family protein
MRAFVAKCYLFAAVVCAAAGVSSAAEPAPATVEFFESKIRPVFVEHCVKCHGPEKQWSNFRIDSYAALLKGGDFGIAVVPGKPEESLLIKAVRQVDDELSMPPKSKLTDRQIADLEAWIKHGAAYPTEAMAKSKYRDPKHWAFQPVVDPPIPTVNNSAWAESPVDRFILARLEAKGLAPAPRAEKRTLLRRATFDLIGLPPTPEEVAEFLADDRPDAFARVVQRLLDSPAYGERWGRHWLDVVRYADSNGLDENVAHGNAWRYRDYVVSSFNSDMPFEQFVREQLAGDLLPADSDTQRRNQLIATGFLVLGPKVIAEPDAVKMEMDIIDEQIDTVGKAFLGLTLGCARCHDHKFDPIQTVDYYALAGIFKSTRTMESFKKVARWHENPLPDSDAIARQLTHQQQVATKKSEVQKFVDETNAALKAAKPNEALPERPESLYPPEAQTRLKALRDELAALDKLAPELPSAMGVTENQVVEVPIHVRGSHLKLGEVTPRHVPVVFTSVEAPHFSAEQSGRRELAQWLVDPKHPLTYRVFVNRVWRWHFGRGLVRTPDNFGMLGEAPTHPELLDWLTQRFIDKGTSVKELHRLLLLSSTYQQSSQPLAATGKNDPDNVLWGHVNVRRLEAEAARDALLAVSNTLDRTLGGSLLQVKNRDYFFDHTSKDKTSYDSSRRSLYLPIVRNNVYDVFQLLDYPDAAVTTGDRPTTTIAPQALLMLNSELVARASVNLAGRILTDRAADAERIEWLYELTYSRPATAEEIAAGQQFLVAADNLLRSTETDEAKRSRLSWEAYCQTILAANEFIYTR